MSDSQVNTARVVRAGATVPEICTHNVRLGQGCFCPYCPTADAVQRCPIPEMDGFDVQGRELSPGIWGIGTVSWHPASGSWRALADVNGALCVITLKVTRPEPDPTQERHNGRPTIWVCNPCGGEHVDKVTACTRCGSANIRSAEGPSRAFFDPNNR